MRILHDISLRLGEQTVVYPGDPQFRRDVPATIDQAGCEFSTLEMGAHSGTHIDAPAHFIEGGKRLDAFDPSRFVVPAVVVDLPGRDVVGPDDLADIELPAGGAILCKTDNSHTGLAGSGRYSRQYTHLSAEAAEACVAMGASLVGIDYLSVDPLAGDHVAHRILMAAEVLILENIDLAAVQPGLYTLLCPPLAIPSAEACPVRALLGEADWSVRSH
ncbi:MAG: cyclase family protein [Phycisphaerae bacterium]